MIKQAPNQQEGKNNMTSRNYPDGARIIAAIIDTAISPKERNVQAYHQYATALLGMYNNVRMLPEHSQRKVIKRYDREYAKEYGVTDRQISTWRSRLVPMAAILPYCH